MNLDFSNALPGQIKRNAVSNTAATTTTTVHIVYDTLHWTIENKVSPFSLTRRRGRERKIVYKSHVRWKS